MAQLSYDIVSRDGGWAILVTPAPDDGFATRQAAFDAAAELARKLRFAGTPLHVRAAHEGAQAAPGARKSARA
ncbi:MAG: hypothetical protein ACRECO_01850 [Xanthobacteraceae bacterium]